jgi:NAD(P)H-hydrate repair Nnr-like enzyme with NAD(P)H-hydrate dehydratase domain
MDQPQQAKTGSGNAVIVTGNNRIFGAAILNPGSAAAVLTIYDGVDNSGPVIARLVAAANGVSAVTPDVMVPTATGIYAEVSGTGANYVVYYE